MSKHLMEGFVYHVAYSYGEPVIRWTASKNMADVDPAWVLVGPHSFEVEVPDDFDPRPQQVAALQAEKQKVRAEFAKRITDLDEQISKLLCLEAA